MGGQYYGDVVSRGDTGMGEYGFNTMRVKQKDFLPVVWSMIGLSFIFLPLRYWSRWRTFGRFFADDLLALFAWLSAAAMGAVAIWMVDSMYWTMDLAFAPIDPSEFHPSLLTYIRRYSYGANISYMLMYTSLWSVKLSFLLFFYRLGPRLITGIKWHWWSVTVVTVAAYAVTFATYPYMCSFGTYKQIATPYCTTEQSMSFVNLKVNVGLDVGTDVLSMFHLPLTLFFSTRNRKWKKKKNLRQNKLTCHPTVMTIPLNILWRSRIPCAQSLALGGVFSLVLVTITIAIVRAALSTVGVTKQMDSPWVLVWSAAEANIAIVVACIGSFRMLFVIANRREEMLRRGEIDVRGLSARRRGKGRGMVVKSTTVEGGQGVEEMTSVGGSDAEWGEIGVVESTVRSSTVAERSTMPSTLTTEGTLASSSSGWKTTLRT
ncbi:hypothetical protein PMIN01_05521 [Paraphaeosphaeria minitans]|uniref:Rhodopsin domain-containing protein n=1 Tax=Paraphaeosphaeria minitans TaxID=565426 RepID=A0A9P6GLB4_9PLEO|nr:hypothetical protein PMIN01_05521 [Paraphaeosphaeria minitans]